MPVAAIIFLTQISTMVLIGLWHGVTWNFVLWGLWHGVGLFLQNRWSGMTRLWTEKLETRHALKVSIAVVSAFLTFQYVALGWVWFALPDPALSWKVLLKLFGIG